MLHYLLNVCGLNANDVDQNLRIPLHIVCEHGHPEAFEYLVKKEVSYDHLLNHKHEYH